MTNPQTIYLFKNFNNYFNRKLVLLGTHDLDEIAENPKLVAIQDDMNISTGDGIHAKLYVNFADEKMTKYNLDLINGDPTEFPDYVVINLETEAGVSKLSRWFIIESLKKDYGGYDLTLQRDVLADFYEDIQMSVCFLEKGFVEENNPLIFNNENMQFNQIKKQEHLIKDFSGCGWIVGYIAKQDNNGQAYSISFEVGTETINPDYLYNNLEQNIAEAIDNGSCLGNIAGFSMTIDIKNEGYYCRAKNNFDSMGNFLNYDCITDWMLFWQHVPIGNARIKFPDYNFNTETLFIDEFNYAYKNAEINDQLVCGAYGRGLGREKEYLVDACQRYLVSLSQYIPDILEYDNKIIELESGAFIRLHVKKKENTIVYPTIFMQGPGGPDNWNDLGILLYDYILPIYNAPKKEWEVDFPKFNRYPKTGDLEMIVEEYEITQEPISGTPITITIPTTRNTCGDSAYDMFALPYGGLNGVGDKNASLRIATGLTKALGDYLYDLQILPFCPALDFIDVLVSQLPGDWTAMWSYRLTENYDFVYVEDENQREITRIIFPLSSKQNFKIYKKPYIHPSLGYIQPSYLDYRNEINNYENKSIGTKILDQTYLFRFVSPNYASIFEFSVAKNGCVIDYINVNINYKPYNPFIRVAPNFQGLYSMEYTDQRGLICGGDYSLSIISNAWTNYEINNKNYQLMFDRQIQNLGVSQEIAQEQQLMKIFNIIPTALAGAVGGSMFGGGFGAIAGSGIALGTSILNQSLSADWLSRSQKEAKSYLTDNFNYTLGNIKAIPNSLTKVSALNEINKIFPFIEVYEATDEEKNLFASKLHYNGMTINKIVGLGSYIASLPQEEVFIKGQLIRSDNSNCDSHITYQIYEELLKGIYINKGDYTK